MCRTIDYSEEREYEIVSSILWRRQDKKKDKKVSRKLCYSHEKDELEYEYHGSFHKQENPDLKKTCPSQ